jgi:hypothetical protein
LQIRGVPGICVDKIKPDGVGPMIQIQKRQMTKARGSTWKDILDEDNLGHFRGRQTYQS